MSCSCYSFYLNISWFCLESGNMNSWKLSPFQILCSQGSNLQSSDQWVVNRSLQRNIWKVFFSPSLSPFFLLDYRLVVGAVATFLWSQGNKHEKKSQKITEMWLWPYRTTESTPAAAYLQASCSVWNTELYLLKLLSVKFTFICTWKIS